MRNLPKPPACAGGCQAVDTAQAPEDVKEHVIVEVILGAECGGGSDAPHLAGLVVVVVHGSIMGRLMGDYHVQGPRWC